VCAAERLSLCSHINTAKPNGVDPEVWLADVLERVCGKVKANRIDSLLPWAWKAEREDIADQERRAA